MYILQPIYVMFNNPKMVIAHLRDVCALLKMWQALI